MATCGAAGTWPGHAGYCKSAYRAYSVPDAAPGSGIGHPVLERGCELEQFLAQDLKVVLHERDVVGGRLGIGP